MRNQRPTGRVAVLALWAGVAITAHGPTCFGQPENPTTVRVEDPTSPASRAKAAKNKRKVELERELAKLRATYFRGARNVEQRQIGIAKLRAYNQPEAYPPLLKVFERESEDVQRAIIGMLIEQGTAEADATLAWAAVMLNNAEFRSNAGAGLRQRVRAAGVTQPIFNVLDMALQSESEDRANAAAEFADEFEIVGLIPRLISAQVSGNPGGGGGESDRTGDLAFIAIGRQVAFISDLTPVVSDSAVGFDPTISVANEGTVVAIQDAAVTIYRTEIHASLVGLTSRVWGQPTSGLGYDYEAWKRWYFDQFLPSQQQKGAETDPDREPSASSPGDSSPPKESGGG
jgi:hypothetical protein